MAPSSYNTVFGRHVGQWGGLMTPFPYLPVWVLGLVVLPSQGNSGCGTSQACGHSQSHGEQRRSKTGGCRRQQMLLGDMRDPPCRPFPLPLPRAPW